MSKATITIVTDSIMERLNAALEKIAAHTSNVGDEDADEQVDLLQDRLDECIKEAAVALAETKALREVYEQIKG